MTMTTDQLEALLMRASREQTKTRLAARNRGMLLAHWLSWIVSSDQEMNHYGSRATIARRRADLRLAGLVPLTTAAELAGLATALKVAHHDREALVRLAWTLRGATGGLRCSHAAERFGALVDEAQALMQPTRDEAA